MDCAGIFTTVEHSDLTSSLILEMPGGKPLPFSRDRLFIDIYESCKHRPSAIPDAVALTETIVGHVLADRKTGSIHRDDLVELVLTTLKRFDPTAGTIYAAYHPPTLTPVIS